MASNKPYKKFSVGSVSCAIWENEATVNEQRLTMLKASVERRYKDSTTGTWKSTSSFSKTEVPVLICCLQMAFEAMVEANGRENEP